MVTNIIKEYCDGDTFREIGERHGISKRKAISLVQNKLGILATQRLKKENRRNRKRRSQ